jgi:pilus assembly protein Flp/PilA
MYSSLVNKAMAFVRREDGPTAVEYAVMLALIIAVCVAAVTALGTATVKPYETLEDDIPTLSP